MDIKKKILEKPLQGIFVSLRDPSMAHLASAAGCDFIVVDQEHFAFSPSDLVNFSNACRASGVHLIVRIGEISRSCIQHALECGSSGVLAPMVETKSQAETLADFCLYSPKGKRGFHGLTGASSFGRIPEYPGMANQTVFIGAQIETAEGLRNLKEILSCERIDMILAGPGDLSLSLGCQGNYDHPDLKNAVAEILDEANRAGKIAGIYSPGPEFFREYSGKVRFNIFGVDSKLLIQSAKDQLQKFKIQG